MKINDELRNRIGIALNEAILLGVEFNREKNTVGCSFSLVAMDQDENVPEDNRLLFIFKPVGRFVASYRKKNLEDEKSIIEKFEPESILEVIKKFKGLPIYGWDFINRGDEDYNTWKELLSFDYSTINVSGMTNTIDLFQDGLNEYIDIRVWFDDFEIFTPKYEPVRLEQFLENGKRGWDAIYANNHKMNNYGIIPATIENKQNLKKTFAGLQGRQPLKSLWAKLKSIFKY